MKNLFTSLVFITLLIILNQFCFAQKSFDIKVPETITFSDDFTNNSKKWLDKENDSIVSKIQNGIYYHVARAMNIITIQNPYVSLFNENNYFKYSVETNYIEGPGFFGLVYGFKDTRNFNLFLINGNSEYMVVNTTDGKSETLLKGKSEKINKGKGAKNILTVKNGNYKFVNYRVEYLVNGSSISGLTEAEEHNKPVEPKKSMSDMIMNDPFFNKAYGLDFANTSSIGLFSTKGSSVGFDNLILKTKPNKGRIVMMNNTWVESEEDKKYLNPLIKSQELSYELKRKTSEQGRIDSVYLATKKEIASIPIAKSNNITAEIDAVICLKDILFRISTAFIYFEYMELVSEKESIKTYKIKHSLPNVEGLGQYINKPKAEGIVNVLLARNLDEIKTRKLVNQYISNLLAAEIKYAKLLDPEPENQNLHFIGIGYAKDFFNGYRTTAYLLPKKNEGGLWDTVLKIEFTK